MEAVSPSRHPENRESRLTFLPDMVDLPASRGQLTPARQEVPLLYQIGGVESYPVDVSRKADIEQAALSKLDL